MTQIAEEPRDRTPPRSASSSDDRDRGGERATTSEPSSSTVSPLVDVTEVTQEESSTTKKERVLHTRVPAVLERELKRFADNLRVPVSNLVRTILEDALSVADAATENVEERLKKAAHQLELEREKLKKKVMPDPLSEVFAYQDVTLAQASQCIKCGRDLQPGEKAHLGLTDGPARPGSRRIFACDACIPK